MILTCIINQLDFNAGTKGAAFCIPSGNDRVAKATTKSDRGLVTAPINDIATLFSITIVIAVIPQIKNIKDSYRLLKGKYPFSNHLEPRFANIGLIKPCSMDGNAAEESKKTVPLASAVQAIEYKIKQNDIIG